MKKGNQPILKVENISKSFDAVQALQDVSLEIYPGEIVALVGDNGAGKSTLVKCISGVYEQDEGRIIVKGEEVKINNPTDAQKLKIETVYQNLLLVDRLDVPGNLFLGREPVKEGFLGSLFAVLDQGKMKKRAKESLKKLKINIPGLEDDQPVHKMSGGQRQAAALARAAFWQGEILLLDEPTAALGAEQSQEVDRLIEELAQKGIAMLVISHNLEHVFQIVDRIVVLRHGKKVLDCSKEDTNQEEVIGCITGLYDQATISERSK